MSRASSDTSPGARALRAAGYVKLPSLWVKEDERDLVIFMAEKHLPEINRIKDRYAKVDPRRWDE